MRARQEAFVHAWQTCRHRGSTVCVFGLVVCFRIDGMCARVDGVCVRGSIVVLDRVNYVCWCVGSGPWLEFGHLRLGT